MCTVCRLLFVTPPVMSPDVDYKCRRHPGYCEFFLSESILNINWVLTLIGDTLTTGFHGQLQVVLTDVVYERRWPPQVLERLLKDILRRENCRWNSNDSFLTGSQPLCAPCHCKEQTKYDTIIRHDEINIPFGQIENASLKVKTFIRTKERKQEEWSGKVFFLAVQFKEEVLVLRWQRLYGSVNDSILLN